MTPRSLASASSDPPAEWTVADLLAVLARRRAWIAGSLAACCALAGLYCLCATPRYRATAIIEVQKQSRGAFGLDNATADTPTTDVSDSFDDNLTLQTEIGILQSDSVTLDVIRRTGLEATPDYFAPRRPAFPWASALLHAVLFWRKPVEPLTVPIGSAPNRRYVALKIFASHAKIAPASGTRLISVSYSDPDPARAAVVVGALLQSLADAGYQSRSADAAQSAAWLEAQLAGLRQQTDALDARAAALDREAGAFGDDDAHNTVLARLDDLNAALAAAQSNRIVREAIWRAVQNGDPEVLSGLGGNPAAASSTQNSFALLQSLRAQEAVAQSRIAESAGRYGENWPALAEQRAGLQTIRNSIQEEIHRLGDRAHSDYEIALQAENSARDAFNQQKDLASRLTGNAVALRLARQQAAESRNLYTALQGRLQQAGVLQGLHSGNFAVIAPALVPPPNHPTSPNVPLLAAVALAAGSFLGCAAAIARELTDNSIHSAAQLEALLEAPVFAALPAPHPQPSRIRRWFERFLPLPARAGLALEAVAASDFAIPAPQSPWVEALHRLRANLLLSHSGSAPQVILVTACAANRTPSAPPDRSAQPDYFEDPSPSLALSLAAILAQHGASVLFVDADLRSAPAAGAGPVAPGLSDILSSGDAPTYHRPGAAPLLSVVSAGPRPPCPSELIASARMAGLLARWRQEFPFIVIDGPPAVYADALVLAQLSDAVLLAARAGVTARAQILPAFQALSRQVADHAVLGLVLEDIPHGGPYAQA